MDTTQVVRPERGTGRVCDSSLAAGGGPLTLTIPAEAHVMSLQSYTVALRRAETSPTRLSGREMPDR